MSTLKNLALIGGDRRQKYIGNYFSQNDYNTLMPIVLVSKYVVLSKKFFLNAEL